jgi:hypothetical protein
MSFEQTPKNEKSKGSLKHIHNLGQTTEGKNLKSCIPFTKTTIKSSEVIG